MVRVNPATTADHELDLEALARTEYTTVMLAKTESADQVARAGAAGRRRAVETPLGALAVTETGAGRQRVRRHVGRRGSVRGDSAAPPTADADGSYRDVAKHVRSQTLLAAKAYGRMALDSVYLDIKDLDGLRAETDDAVAVGFDAKVAIHPTQVAVIRAGYAPTDEQVHWARHVLDAARSERGVFQFEGMMVDMPSAAAGRAHRHVGATPRQLTDRPPTRGLL